MRVQRAVAAGRRAVVCLLRTQASFAHTHPLSPNPPGACCCSCASARKPSARRPSVPRARAACPRFHPPVCVCAGGTTGPPLLDLGGSQLSLVLLLLSVCAKRNRPVREWNFYFSTVLKMSASERRAGAAQASIVVCTHVVDVGFVLLVSNTTVYIHASDRCCTANEKHQTKTKL